MTRWRIWALALALFITHLAANAGPLRFQISGLAAYGPNVGLALNFIDGGPPDNRVDVYGFSGDGSLGTVSTQGDVVGGLSTGYRLQDSSFFSELLLSFTGGDSLSFLFESSAMAPGAGAFADAFSLFLIDLGTGATLFDTTDGSGANALFLQVVDGSDSGLLDVYAASQAPGVQWSVQPLGTPGTVPEPSTLAVVALALLLLVARGALRGALCGAVWRRWRVGALLLGAAACVLPAQADDISASVQVTRSGFVLNRSTNTFDTQVTLTNRATAPLSGPLQLVIDSIQPANVVHFNTYGSTEAGKSYVAVPLVNGVLAAGASATVVVKFINGGLQVTQVNFKVEGQVMDAARSAQLQLRAVAPNAQGGPGAALGAGYAVKVDGVLRGVTDANGRLTLTVPVAAQVVSVSMPPNEGGSATIQGLVAGQTRDVQVVVEDGKEIYGDGRLRFEQVQQGLLSRSAQRISLRFLDFERPVRLATLNNAALIDAGGRAFNFASVFTLASDGTISAAPAAFFAAVGSRSGRLTLEVDGEDAAGLTYQGRASFYLADYRVRVQLQAPPSNPGLALGGVVISGNLLNTDVRFVAQADAAGYITVPDLPAGNLALSGSTAAGGITYTGGGTAALTRDSLVRLTLRAAQDVLAGVPAISVQALPAGAPRPSASSAREVAPEERAQRQALHASLRAAAPALPLDEPTRVSISVTGAGQNQQVERSAQLVVKRGVKKVLLSYTVSTAEYPTYVLAQSIYNDVWSLSVLSNSGGNLFEQTRQINSQLTQEPTWRTNGSTGLIKRELDVEALTASADATLIVRATSVNIGDGILPTSVTATLDAGVPLLIGTITPSAMPAGTSNDGSLYSIPRPGGSNVLARTFTVNVTKPAGSTLDSVAVELLNDAGNPLMTVVQDAAPGTADVEVLAQTDTSARLRVRGTISTPASTVAGTPPPTRDSGYRFKVKGTDADGVALEDEKDLNGKRALWRMPDGRARYGGRDAGFDDWAARGTYLWLQTNGALVREINDISGEHGRDIGHETHERGTDIDMFHFYVFPGVTTAAGGGLANFNALRADVVTAFQTIGNPTPPQAAVDARARVVAWVQASRTGLTNLANLASVQRLYYCSGPAASGLPAGWCRTLLLTGTATRPGPGGVPQTLNLGLPAYTNDTLAHNNVHNDHIHITLNRAQIND